MNTEALNQLCAQALQRINYFINSSAAQQIRRMRETWSNTK